MGRGWDGGRGGGGGVVMGMGREEGGRGVGWDRERGK